VEWGTWWVTEGALDDNQRAGTSLCLALSGQQRREGCTGLGRWIIRPDG
jgi:hypothetical protein